MNEKTEENIIIHNQKFLSNETEKKLIEEGDETQNLITNIKQRPRMNSVSRNTKDAKNTKTTTRVKDDDFYVPLLKCAWMLKKYNYTLKQLKQIAKKYGIKCKNLRKSDLIEHIYTSMVHTYNSKIIQTSFRKFLFRKLRKSRKLEKLDKCVNDTDFLTLDSINEIDKSNLVVIEEDKHCYAFHVDSLFNLLIKKGQDTKNPYTRNKFDKDVKTQMNDIIRLCSILKLDLEISKHTEENELQNMSPEQRMQMRVMNLFMKMDELGNYTNPNWFTGLSHRNLFKFIRELREIWIYRAGLTQEIKRRIVPPLGNPFGNQSIHILRTLQEIELRKYCIFAMDKLINSSPDLEQNGLGATMCLTALTLASNEAAQAMPWLYESAVYTP